MQFGFIGHGFGLKPTVIVYKTNHEQENVNKASTFQANRSLQTKDC